MTTVTETTDKITVSPLEWAQYNFLRETQVFKWDKSEDQTLRVEHATKTLVQEMLADAPYLSVTLQRPEGLQVSDLILLSNSLIRAQR